MFCTIFAPIYRPSATQKRHDRALWAATKHTHSHADTDIQVRTPRTPHTPLKVCETWRAMSGVGAVDNVDEWCWRWRCLWPQLACAFVVVAVTRLLLLLLAKLYFDRTEASPFKAVTKRKIELCFLLYASSPSQMICCWMPCVCVYVCVCRFVCVSFFIKYLLFFYLMDFAPIRNNCTLAIRWLLLLLLCDRRFCVECFHSCNIGPQRTVQLRQL